MRGDDHLVMYPAELRVVVNGEPGPASLQFADAPRGVAPAPARARSKEHRSVPEGLRSRSRPAHAPNALPWSETNSWIANASGPVAPSCAAARVLVQAALLVQSHASRRALRSCRLHRKRCIRFLNLVSQVRFL